MKGEKRKYNRNKMIYLLLKPLFQKYSMEINKKDYYTKEIPLNVKKYYEHLERKLGKKLEEYHIPYEIWEEDVEEYVEEDVEEDVEEEKKKYIFHTKYWGMPLNYHKISPEKQKEGEEWAKQKLYELHNKGLIHGDLINIDHSGRVVINRGNILFNKDTGEYRFIDMGFDKTKKKLDFNNKNLTEELEREKKLLERYEDEYVKSAKKPHGSIKVNKQELDSMRRQLFF